MHSFLKKTKSDQCTNALHVLLQLLKRLSTDVNSLLLGQMPKSREPVTKNIFLRKETESLNLYDVCAESEKNKTNK